MTKTAGRSAYLATTSRLLTTIDLKTRIFAAHMEDPSIAIKAPVLDLDDLRALASSLTAIDAGTVHSRGFYPRIFPVRGPIQLATGWSWNNR